MSTITARDVNYIRNNIHYHKRKNQPRLPKSLNETIAILGETDVESTEGEQFLFVNNSEKKIVVFSTESNMTALCNTDKIYLDGTFSYCVKYFLQLFTIHIERNGFYIPIAFCLLPDKKECTYKFLFDILCEKCKTINLQLKPKIVTADFEQAIHSAVAATWNDAKLIGCRFHLGQAWFRKLQSIGLTKEYKDESSIIGKWLQYIFGLPFLNPSEVGDCFSFDLMEDMPNDERVSSFADYLVDFYIGGDARFPPEMWAEMTDSIQRTTNACESFHSKFNENFHCSHPTIFNFLNILKQFQTDTIIKLRSVSEKPRIRDTKVRKRQDFLSTKICQYERKEITRYNYVKCLSYMYKVNNK